MAPGNWLKQSDAFKKMIMCSPTIARSRVVIAAFAAFLIPRIGNDALATCSSICRRWGPMTDAVQAIVSVDSKTLSMLQEPRSWWLENVIFLQGRGEDVEVGVKILNVRTSHSFSYWWYIYVLWTRCAPVTRTLSLMSRFHVVIAIINWSGIKTGPTRLPILNVFPSISINHKGAINRHK